jgi:hypothetical protein
MNRIEQYFEDFVRDEMALEAISGLIGDTYEDIFAEEEKSTPDAEKIARLEERSKTLYLRQQKIYEGNREIQEQCIDEFAQRCRELYGTPFFDKPEQKQKSGESIKTKANKRIPIKCPQKTY